MAESPKTTAANLGEDRISSLPDDIIHDQILPRLRSTRLAGRLIVLSRRWAHLLRSNPILEMDAENNFKSKVSPQNFAAAVARKLSTEDKRYSTLTVVRIDLSSKRYDRDFCSTFLDGLLETIAAAKIPPREIAVTAWVWNFDYPYSLPRSLLLGRNNIQVLMLFNCNFDRYVDLADTKENPFAAAFGGSLRTLSLANFRFPDDGRILNSLIAAAASSLETLDLVGVGSGIRRLQVRNFPKLRRLVVLCDGIEDLETVWIHHPSDGDSVVIMSGLRALVIYASKERNRDANNLIRESPSLEPFTLTNFPQVFQLKIVSSNNNTNNALLQVTSGSEKFSLPNFNTDFGFLYFYPTIFSQTGKSVVEVSIRKRANPLNFLKLSESLVELSRFWVTLNIDELLDEFEDEESPAPTIEHLKLPLDLLTSRDKNFFVDGLFWCCRPKLVSFIDGPISEESFLSTTKLFVMKDCKDRAQIKCKCWRIQLKDVKIITRTINGSIIEEEVVGISEFMISSLAEKDQIWFLLIWA